MNPWLTVLNPHTSESLLLLLSAECCNLTAHLIGVIHSWVNCAVHTSKYK